MKEYAIVVRTDSYAGNFERELCAHLTGQIGECEVGEEYVDKEIQKIFNSLVTRKSDDHGCWRPVSLGGCQLTPGYSGQDAVIWLSKLPTSEHMKIIREKASTFSDVYPENAYRYKPFIPIKIEGIDILSMEVIVNVVKLKI